MSTSTGNSADLTGPVSQGIGNDMSYTPPHVPSPIRPERLDAPFRWFGGITACLDSMNRFTAWVEKSFGSESYGALRVFDLFTLLAITLAFALLFAFMRLLEPVLGTALASTTIVISLFITGIAIAQVLLCGGHKPRIASVCAAPVVWQLIWGGLAVPAIVAGAGDPSPLLLVFCSSILAFPAGYLAGAVVAGVFLLADAFRTRYMKRIAPTTEQQESNIWD